MDEALSQAQLAELKTALERLRDEAEQNLSVSSENAKPVDLDLSIGRLSRVDALQQQHMAIARRERTAQQLQQARSALSRFEAGDYGICARCEEPIGYARLRVRPETAVCLRCQPGGRGAP